jgi:hypothetical protein
VLTAFAAHIAAQAADSELTRKQHRWPCQS